MTPDKIYLNIPKIQPELDNTTWDTKTYADCENVEYIRKDALMEWLKTKTESAEIVVANSVKVTRQVYKQVIDKIESL